jgi:hypothetical protein
MTKTETKFRQFANKLYPDGFIRKMPDFKTGAKGVGGLPDYLVINGGQTIWYEVKKVPGYTINLESHFTEAQKMIFPQMNKAGAGILIFCFYRGGIKIIGFDELYRYQKIKLENNKNEKKK